MAKSKIHEEEAPMDMTPMIDCVFLLMIFFVLVIDLSQKDMEDLILPMAQYAVPDENPPDGLKLRGARPTGNQWHESDQQKR